MSDSTTANSKLICRFVVADNTMPAQRISFKFTLEPVDVSSLKGKLLSYGRKMGIGMSFQLRKTIVPKYRKGIAW